FPSLFRNFFGPVFGGRLGFFVGFPWFVPAWAPRGAALGLPLESFVIAPISAFVCLAGLPPSVGRVFPGRASLAFRTVSLCIIISPHKNARQWM
ncbi:MAG: hypothetical protein ACR2FX_06090, partial [Chthoniobacterales bacterium]